MGSVAIPSSGRGNKVPKMPDSTTNYAYLTGSEISGSYDDVMAVTEIDPSATTLHIWITGGQASAAGYLYLIKADGHSKDRIAISLPPYTTSGVYTKTIDATDCVFAGITAHGSIGSGAEYRWYYT